MRAIKARLGTPGRVADATIGGRADSSMREDVLDPVVLDHDGRAPPCARSRTAGEDTSVEAGQTRPEVAALATAAARGQTRHDDERAKKNGQPMSYHVAGSVTQPSEGFEDLLVALARTR